LYMGNSSHVSFFFWGQFCGQLGGGQGECLKYLIASFSLGWKVRGLGSGIWDLDYLIASFFLGWNSKAIREWDMGFGIPNCFLFFRVK
jgi:hypothetical protein